MRRSRRQTLTFLPGEMVKAVTVDLVNDAGAEPGEYFDLVCPRRSARRCRTRTSRVFIGAQRCAGGRRCRGSGVRRGGRRVQRPYLEFVVTLSAPSTQTVSVSYNNGNVTAANGTDYVAQASTLTFAPGETTQGGEDPGARHRRRRSRPRC